VGGFSRGRLAAVVVAVALAFAAASWSPDPAPAVALVIVLGLLAPYLVVWWCTRPRDLRAPLPRCRIVSRRRP
jgi:hypothetical protein